MNNWEMKPLGEDGLLLGVHPGFACGKKDIADGVPHLRMNNISKDGLLEMALIRRIPRDVAESQNRFVEPGDILFNNTNSTELVGKSCIFTGWQERCAFSNHLTRLRPNPERLCAEWLFICLRDLWLQGYFAANCVEFVGQSAFNKDKLLEVKIPMPPTAEQRRIVARVEALTGRLEQARQARQAALAEAETVSQAAVDSAFTERSSAWETDTLEALCGKPQYGYTESASAAPIGPRFVRITDIQGGRVNWETVPYCECDELDKYRLQTGDILFARTGATTGKSYLVKDPPEAVFASYLIRVRRGQRILPEFLWWYFQSSNYWHAVFSGTEDGNRPNMNGSKLAGLEVPFPNSLETQKQIIKRLDAVRFKLSELQQLQNETEAELASFTPALLAKAFRGEL